MFEDDVTFKLYAAAEDDDERDLDAEDSQYVEDEEEEESYSGGDDLTLDDADYEPITTRVEEVEVFAMPATPVAQRPQPLPRESLTARSPRRPASDHLRPSTTPLLPHP